MFLAAVNSEHVQEHWQASLTPFFKSFDRECKEIQQAFMQLNEYRWILPYAQAAANEKLEERKAERRRDRKTVSGLNANVAGSFINLILCTWENRFLGVACKTVTAMGYEVSVNNFDGMMLRGNHYPEGDEPKVRDLTLCPALENALFTEFGIKMGWSMKRHSSNIKLDGRDDQLKRPYSVVAQPLLESICRVGCEYFLELADGTRVVESRRGLNERLEGYTTQCMFDESKSWHKSKGTFADTLCRDPKLRTYERAEMYPDPSECPPTVYNLWKPMPCEAWDVAEADPTSDHVAAFRKHVLILAGRDEKVAAFIELFIAHMLHFPWKKPNAWLVFMSEEGAGKGTLVQMIILLVGSGKVKEISNVQRSLLGTFNQAMLDGFLLVLDEAAGKHLFEGKEELKNLITAPTVPVNQKHEKEKDVRSYARFMMTIQPRAVPTKKGDRRGVIVRSSDELIGNKKYTRDIYERMENPDFPRDVHAYLMTLRPPLVFQPDELPKTEVQRELQAANADIFESWIVNVVEKWLVCTCSLYLRGQLAYPDRPLGMPFCLSDYKGEWDPTNLLPEFAMQDLFDNFRQFAADSHALNLIDGIRFQVFVSRFSFCRWRNAFAWKPNGTSYPKHKVRGIQQQCRRWDMAALARDLGIIGVVSAANKIQAVCRGKQVRRRIGGMQSMVN